MIYPECSMRTRTWMQVWHIRNSRYLLYDEKSVRRENFFFYIYNKVQSCLLGIFSALTFCPHNPQPSTRLAHWNKSFFFIFLLVKISDRVCMPYSATRECLPYLLLGTVILYCIIYYKNHPNIHLQIVYVHFLYNAMYVQN